MFRRAQKRSQSAAANFILLGVAVPKDGDFSDGLAEHLIASLAQTLEANRPSRLSGVLADHLSLEIVIQQSGIKFYIWGPLIYQAALNQLISEAYPGVKLSEQTLDYSRPIRQGRAICATELALKKNELLPIIPLGNYQPEYLSAILGAMAKLAQADVELWLQVLIRPHSQSWKLKATKAFRRLAKTPGSLAAMDAKFQRPTLQTKVRLMAVAEDKRTARLCLETVGIAIDRLGHIMPNSFKLQPISSSHERQLEYHLRFFIDKGFPLNSQELASLFNPMVATRFKSAPTARPISSSKDKPALSAFEKLLEEAEAKPKTVSAFQPKAEIKPSRPKKTPQGIVKLTAKATVKGHVGKLVTSRIQNETKVASGPADDELVIKLH